MPTSARQKRYVDMGRLRSALAGPGADTRVWVGVARIDDDPDAVRWEPELGWLVDVTFVGGPLDGEGPICCRVGATFAAGGATRSDPPEPGCAVLVAIPSGDPNSGAVVVARMHNADGCEVPTTVFGLPLTEAQAMLFHILVSPHGLLQEYAGLARLRALSWAIEGEPVALAGQTMLGVPLDPATGLPLPAAQQPVLLAAAVAAINTYTAAVATAIGAIPPAAPLGGATAATALTAAATALTISLTGALSTRSTAQ